MKAARLSCGTNRVTATTSCIKAMKPMSKRQAEIDRVLFIPSHTLVGRAANTALLFSVVMSGLAAAVVALIRQVA